MSTNTTTHKQHKIYKEHKTTNAHNIIIMKTILKACAQNWTTTIIAFSKKQQHQQQSQNKQEIKQHDT